VHLHDLEALRHYWASVTAIRRFGFALERGAGKQIALVLDRWQPTRELAECDTPELEPEPPAFQLALFGGRL